jgi:pilus assembly protein CpaC
VYDDPEAHERLERAYQALEEQINRNFPCSHVQLSLLGDQVVIRGQAKDAVDATSIEMLVRRTVRQQPGRAAGGAGYDQVNVTLSQTTFGPGGEVNREAVSGPANQFALPADDEASPWPKLGVINLLRIPGVQQVALRVTVAEMNRTAARSIGLNFSIDNNSGVTVFESLVGGLVASGTGAGGLVNLPVMLDNGQTRLAINALRNLMLARTLAEPTLTALNGQTASFFAGGQFPVPVVTGFTASGLQGVAFVPFGVQVQFTPYIVDRDRIRLQVNATVSTRDESLGTNIGGSSLAGGTSVSGLNSRSFQTTVDLRDGQTMAVAGLIQNNFGSTSDRVPLWGDLPIIGRTGSFDRTSSGEQELVILITPELVQPIPACQGPSLPGADVFEPTDLEFYLYGRLESRRTADFRTSVRTDFFRLTRGQHCDDVYIDPRGQPYNCCPQFAPPPGSADYERYRKCEDALIIGPQGHCYECGGPKNGDARPNDGGHQ